jgi:hypothetical protein
MTEKKLSGTHQVYPHVPRRPQKRYRPQAQLPYPVLSHQRHARCAPSSHVYVPTAMRPVCSVLVSGWWLLEKLKSCTMSAARGDWTSGGERIMVTRGRGWEVVSEVPVPVAVLFVDGLVLVLVLVRQMRSMSARVRLIRLGAGTDEAGYADCDAPLVDRGRPIVLDKWDGGKDGTTG